MPRAGPPWPRAALVAVLLAAGCQAPGAAPAHPQRVPPPDPGTADDAPVPGIPGEPGGPAPADPPGVFGVAGLTAYPLADRVAPNGVEYTPVFAADLHANLWLARPWGLYGFADAAFWAQRAAPGVTNPAQGMLDFSKREFDLAAGLAWNAAGRWEARAFAYSLNNLNRGTSVTAPAGYADGVGVEGRYYLSAGYDALGTPAFDAARQSFVGLGYYPAKDLVDNRGQPFDPGPFARACLTLDLAGDRAYVFADGTLTGTRSATPKLVDVDLGAAARPLPAARRWEVRAGFRARFDLRGGDPEREVYLSVRYVY